MEIKQICESYFNCFSELKNYENNDAQVTALAVLKLFSFPIVFIPVGFALVYGCALLAERIKEILEPSSQAQTVNNVALDKLGVQSTGTGKDTPQEQIPTTAATTVVNATTDNSNSSICCPKHYEPYYQKTPKKFTEKIWQSSDYTPKEKDLLFENAFRVYQEPETGHLLRENDWVSDTITVNYLKWLTTKNPTFSSIPLLMHQLKDKTLEQDMERTILSVLPANIDQGPRIYGHPLEVNGNHRTAFIIDMDNHTVEYFNSFGGDITAKKPLEALTNALSTKYGVQFCYHNRTKKGLCLQPDGYQCGIWAGKLVKERFEQGISFDPRSCKKFDIAQYRKEVYAKAYKINFFNHVGAHRLASYLENAFPGADYPFHLEQQIEIELPRQRLIDITYPYVQWGKENKIPPIMESLFQEAVKLYGNST